MKIDLKKIFFYLFVSFKSLKWDLKKKSQMGKQTQNLDSMKSN